MSSSGEADSSPRTPLRPTARPDRVDSESDGNALIIHPQASQYSWWRRWRNTIIAASFAVLATPFTTLGSWLLPAESPIDPTNYALRTRRILETTPLIDGHNDFPWMLRVELHNRIYDGRFNPNQRLLGHTDIGRMRQGMMGGQFWSVYVKCDTAQQHFEDPSWIVRDTLEQIDVAKRFIAESPEVFTYCETPSCARAAFKNGRIASMLGIEGGHQLGGSIAALRQAYDLGVRYITTTHNCDNAWATSTSTVARGNPDKGLTALGAAYVRESNRLGMMIDLSHVSHQTMRDILSITQAPVIFSHSGAFSVTPHLRNVPDDVLRGLRRNGGIVMAVFVNRFLNMKDPSAVTIHDVVDHIWHLAEVAGWEHVGIGSDFSGTPFTPSGLEDVSKYPDLIELLMARGASDDQIRLLVGDNILRVWGTIDRRAKEIQAEGEKPVEEEWEGRKWHRGYKHSPYMFRETRELAAREDWGEPEQFNVDKSGKHASIAKADNDI
ncbi:membrane dipeptidase-domain-containing protein [Annulohypoxylon truncatum]|uniref:membrane dipeptidase-domain-containing protein n=1 Tax=Annulohypoxylon truncatum TaxID=327061 RepID=UPI0020072447|nr:membrane dipeptidase-domain-containing protein [Annulohypoxylon truncatum]KAI1209011.1 membrane dipeptidase-domain-containing protein [Annulohypoxylon truncatum]